LVTSIDRVALCLGSAEHALGKPVDSVPEPFRKPLGHLYDACADSLQMIASSLTEMKPVPDLPATEGLIPDIASMGDESVLRTMSVAAHLHSLADAIHDCRDKANALDWKAWNRNYF
jgi:hypothetical protein